jgi:hypothetical protein
LNIMQAVLVKMIDAGQAPTHESLEEALCG